MILHIKTKGRVKDKGWKRNTDLGEWEARKHGQKPRNEYLNK